MEVYVEVIIILGAVFVVAILRLYFQIIVNRLERRMNDPDDVENAFRACQNLTSPRTFQQRERRPRSNGHDDTPPPEYSKIEHLLPPSYTDYLTSIGESNMEKSETKIDSSATDSNASCQSSQNLPSYATACSSTDNQNHMPISMGHI